MNTPSSALNTAGFSSPVDDAQRVFRGVLEAMARPTSVFPVEVDLTPPGGLGSGAAALVLALCDEYTPIWLDPVLVADSALAQWVRFHTGATIVDEPDRAMFVVVSSLEAAALGDLNQGTDVEPHTSATVIVDLGFHVADGNQRIPIAVTGPGIEATAYWNSRAVPDGFVEEWNARRSDFPCGVDVIFADHDTVFALPRTAELKSLVSEGRDA